MVVLPGGKGGLDHRGVQRAGDPLAGSRPDGLGCSRRGRSRPSSQGVVDAGREVGQGGPGEAAGIFRSPRAPDSGTIVPSLLRCSRWRSRRTEDDVSRAVRMRVWPFCPSSLQIDRLRAVGTTRAAPTVGLSGVARSSASRIRASTAGRAAGSAGSPCWATAHRGAGSPADRPRPGTHPSASSGPVPAGSTARGGTDMRSPEAGLRDEASALRAVRSADTVRAHGRAPGSPRWSRAMCAAQVLGRDQERVPAVGQQVGEGRPQAPISLAGRHHAGVERIEEPIDQPHAFPRPAQRIVGLIVARNGGIQPCRRSRRPRRCRTGGPDPRPATRWREAR